MKIECKHCGRYLMEAKGTVIVEGLICTNTKCKAKLNIKVVTPSSTEKELRYKFVEPEAKPKGVKSGTTE